MAVLSWWVTTGDTLSDLNDKIVLEEWWFPKRKTKTPEVLFVKGLINCAVSFELHKKQRYENANIVWQNYLKYKPLIDQFESEYKDEKKKKIKIKEIKAYNKGIK